MSVDAFTVDGVINVDTTPFESGLTKVTSQLSKLGTSMNEIMEMGGGNWNFNGALNGLKTLKDDIAVIKEDIATMNSEFANTQGIDALKTQIESLRTEMDALKERINQMGSVAQENVTKVGNAIESAKQKTLGWSEQIAKVTEGIVSLMTKEEFSNYILEQQESEVGQINAQWREMQGLIQSNTTFMREIEASGSNIARYFTHETQILERNVALLEQEAELTSMLNQRSRQNATTVSNIAKELNRVANFSREVGTYFANEDKILRMSLRTIQEQDRILADKLAKSERETALAKEIADINKMDMDLRKATGSALSEIVDLTGLEADNILKVANGEKEVLSFIEKQVSAEKERLDLMMAITEMESAQISKVPVTGGKGAKGGKNQLDKMGYLPSRISSMAVTMLGYQEIMDVWEKTTTNINAKGSYAHFGKQLQTDERYLKQTGQTTGQVAKSLTNLDGQLRNLQKDYRKIDMRTVGANAEETAFKYGLQADAIGDLSEVMAIYGSEFVKQGRSQEDSILALNDALDGELRRLKEVNVTSDELKEHGWKGEGDQIGMIKALKEIAEERGYDVTAKQITNLSDAITYAELQLAFFLSDLFEILEPSLRSAVMKLATGFEWLADKVAELKEYLKGLPQPMKDFLKEFGSNAILGLVGLWIGRKIWGAVKNMSLFGGAWEKLMEKLGRTKGMDKATESMGKMGQTTGGTVGSQTGSAKDGLKNWGRNLAKNLGKMAEVFIEVAVAIAMAWALLKEAMLLISDLGKDWEAHKSEFNSGMDFIKSYGIWIIGVSAILGYWFSTMSNTSVPTSNYVNMAKNFGKVALGLALAMGLIAEAIVLLNAPLLAVASIGAVRNWQKENIDSGLATIHMFADALNQITLPVGIFIGALLVASVILGYAPMLGVGLVVGIAISIGLVAEAIFMLNAPLLAIASLGVVAQTLGQSNIQQGADALKIVGQALKTIADAVPSLLVVDFGVLGQELMDIGSKLMTGKDGLTYLSEEIIPNLATFVESFNDSTIEQIDTTIVTNLSQVASQLPTIKSAIDTIRTTIGNGGTGGINVMGFQIGGDTSSLKPKLDALYTDIQDVIDFANKFGDSGSIGDSAVAVSQMATAISQLQSKIALMVTTITGASVKVKSASKQMGSAIKVGFNEGSSGFNTSVISVIAKGISEVQSRYETWHSGGKASAQKLTDGFKTFGGKLKSTIDTEMGYALDKLDEYKDDFYSKGQALGKQLSDGFESSGGLNVGSPANIARAIAQELKYSMDALNIGEQMMYKGGVALGRALTNGYGNSGNLRTNVGVLASKGINNEQLQANAKNVQVNAKKNQQTPQSLNTTINIDMSNSTVIGVQDLDTKIRQAVEKAIVSIHTSDGAIGY